ncbi:LysM peptidoglycan-binding domain-containing protein [Paenibacillus arenilitoris]|uniref:LysM peptidoglycan-binding domain-containing protein n=1 Tax=Paenibacillus arenilitoris TaxID=2772299 RepID=A0A927H4Q3_9BACL|nr:LysM peptidoglycan-binding domain-containing protein [Paenibacillus arenilitoris]MBD2867738.1 LysM peptidoglycan-binding domain-containing protein [Paenibacillus arenilitoris]
MASMEFWLSTLDSKERLRLPVNPEQIAVKTSHGYEDVQVTQLGEYTIIGEAALKEFSLSSLFPRDYHPGYCEYQEIPDPWQTVKQIEGWMKSRRPVRLAITGPEKRIEEQVTIRSFQYSERAGSPGDLYYELELKQYVHVMFRQVKASESGGAAVADGDLRPDSAVPPRTYVVIPRDTLWKIAQRTLGNGDRWNEVYDANRQTIGKDPNNIFPGQKLVIPS